MNEWFVINCIMGYSMVAMGILLLYVGITNGFTECSFFGGITLALIPIVSFEHGKTSKERE